MKKILLLVSISFCIGNHAIAQNSVNAAVGRNVPVLPYIFCTFTEQYEFDIQSEVHISINKNNPNFIILSANTYVDSLGIYGDPVRQQGYYYSTNAGQTWSGGDVFPHNTVLAVSGDPSTTIDANGNIYISTMEPGLNSNFNYYLNVSHDNGATWTLETPPNISAQFDKEMIIADDNASSPYKNNVYCTYTDFTGKYLTGSTISFSRYSGGTFSSPKILFAQDTNGAGTNKGQGSNVQTGPHGEIYVCWANYFLSGNVTSDGLGFCRSYDSGHTFTTPHYPSFIAFNYKGYDNGTAFSANSAFGGVGTGTRVDCFPSMAVDKSCLHNVRIYVAYGDSVGTKYVVQVRYSDDSGTAWSSPATVCTTSSDSNSFFPWITVDDVTGIVCVAYYTTNNSTWSTNTYMAYSIDGGSTYNRALVSDSAHTLAPIDNNKFDAAYSGDYMVVGQFEIS